MNGEIHTTDMLVSRVAAGDRRALARAITLTESTRETDRRQAEELLTDLMPQTGRALRIGISGAPGVGKSSFIAALGPIILGAGKKLAVLAVDPTSPVTGGSILGDKTRMGALAGHPDAFVRPSPSGGGIGGVARRTREAVLLCAAAGFDVVMVETVGVGQSDIAIADMTDLFLLLIAPGGGDELQGIKRGVLERADMIIITKEDGDLKAAAGRTEAEYRHALHLLRGDETPAVKACSALAGTGLDAIWQEIALWYHQAQKIGALGQRRGNQARSWLQAEIAANLLALALKDPTLADGLAQAEAAAKEGKGNPAALARGLVEQWAKGRKL